MKRTVTLLAATLLTAAAAPAAAHPHDRPPFDPEIFTFFTDKHPGGARLGVKVQAMSEDLRDYFGAPRDAGVLVNSVVKDSPAEKAGVKPGDVITEVDGKKVEDTRELISALFDAKEEAALTVIRDKRSLKLHAKLGDSPRARLEGGPHMKVWMNDERVEDLEKRVEELEQRLEKLEKKR